jgi:hypothetical protein
LVRLCEPAKRFYNLTSLARAALRVGQIDQARTSAEELLEAAEARRDDWNYGNAVHHGNLVLGAIALQSGEVAVACERLLAAGRTPGSPQLDSFGPNMELAQELLREGRRDAVCEYLGLCGAFWKMGRESLDQWVEAVRRGDTPHFGANLIY